MHGAIGASYQPNENSMVHAGVTLGGKSMFNIGASFKVGEQDPTLKTSRFEMANKSKTYKLTTHHCAQTTKNYALK